MKNATNQATKAKMQQQDKRTRRNQMAEVVFPLTTKDGRRFEKVAKRVFLTPEELLRAMAFQAVREIEATGHFTLTHICIPKRLT